jgi:hypothetical protein
MSFTIDLLKEGLHVRRVIPVCLLLVIVAVAVHAQTVTTFEGIDASQVGAPLINVDANGAVGTKQFMEWTNTYYQAWDKTTFAPIWPQPVAASTPFTTNGDSNCAAMAGNGIIIFDRLASQWVMASHNDGSTSYYYCIAISNTDDLTSPTLAWYTYQIPLNSFLGTNSKGVTYYPDWQKIATWPDAYYVALDLEDPSKNYEIVGALACALDRTNMQVGGTPNTPQCFLTPNPVTGSVFLGHSLEPADVDGTVPPPTGSPEYFASIENPVLDGSSATSTSFNLWQFHVDWTTPANSTFTQSTVAVPSYEPGCYVVKNPASTACVPEPSTATTKNDIDSVGDRFMFRFAYRNFGGYQTFLASHTIQVGTGKGAQTGIRWYELRGNGTPTLYQSGTISPDTSLYRFIPSIAQDQNANAVIGYSTSSASAHPGMSASWWNLNSPSTPTEFTLYDGLADDEVSYRWGSYSALSVDPQTGCTFWYVNEYFNTPETGGPNWQTRISNFSIPECGSLTVSPTSLAFGSQAMGINSTVQQVILDNGSITALTISNIAFGGTNPGDFTQTNNCGTSVAAGQSCIISVTFNPAGTGARSATLSLSDSAGNSPQVVTLTGNGTNGPILSFSATNVNFGNQVAGTTSAQVPIALTNVGNAAISFSSIVLGGTNPSSFGEADNCQPSLGVGATCTMNLVFSPSATGNFSASVVLSDNAANSPQTIGLSGTGVAPVALSASSISFGTVLVGNSKTASKVTVLNQMNVALTGISIAASGSGFSQTNTCGTSLAAGASCKIAATFTPATSGTVSGAITITDSAITSPQVITLTAVGQFPVLVSPASLSYGQVPVETTTAAKTVTVTNEMKTALTIDSVAFSGTDAGDYAQTNTCGSSLAAAAKCTISVTFTPAATGTRTASLIITDSASTSPQAVALTGTGIVDAALTPASATFPNEPVGTTSPATEFALANNLAVELTGIAMSTTGNFAVSATTCGTSLAAHGKCTISVTFTPTTKGTRTGKLSVSDSAYGSPQTSNLKGTGE